MKLTVLSSLVLSVGIVALAVHADPEIKVTKSGKNANLEAKGNLEITHDIGCVSELKNKYTAADLYRSAAKCVGKNQFKNFEAAFTLAGAYARFDTARIIDPTAGAANQSLIVQNFGNFKGVEADRGKAFFEKMIADQRKGSSLKSLCENIRRIGPPDYYPRYMIQHGMNAFVKDDAGDALKKDFDAKASWTKILTEAMRCP